MDIDTNGRNAPHPRTADARFRLTFGLWLRLGFVGALMVGGAVSSLADGPPASVDAFLTGIAGAAVAVLAWRRAMAALDAYDASGSGAEAEPAAPDRAHRVRVGHSADAIRSRGALAARQG
jgi:hypothetical protein